MALRVNGGDEGMSVEINENTKLPLRWFVGMAASVVSTLGIGIAITLYISRIEAKADTANELIASQKKQLEGLSRAWETSLADQIQYLRSIDQRLSRMEGQMGKQGGSR